MLKRYLLTPGPTPVPPEVLLRMAQPLIHHRTAEFSQLFAEVQEGLRWLFQTAQEVLILAASGTGAMEAAVVNTCAAGDTVIVVNGGKFGERWLQICQAFAVQVIEVKVEWGQAVQVSAVAQALQAHPEARAVLLHASDRAHQRPAHGAAATPASGPRPRARPPRAPSRCHARGGPEARTAAAGARASQPGGNRRLVAR